MRSSKLSLRETLSLPLIASNPAMPARLPYILSLTINHIQLRKLTGQTTQTIEQIIITLAPPWKMKTSPAPAAVSPQVSSVPRRDWTTGWRPAIIDCTSWLARGRQIYKRPASINYCEHAQLLIMLHVVLSSCFPSWFIHHSDYYHLSSLLYTFQVN